MKMRVLSILLVGMLIAGTASATVYVNNANTGTQDGTSWATAFTKIQAGIDAAAGAGGDSVWVAGSLGGGGTYVENTATQTWGTLNYTGTLVLKSNVAVYGGFAGTETALSQRAVHLSTTTINGATARGGAAAYHVVACGNAASSVTGARLDGFTITGGNAAGVAGDYDTFYGGGLYIYQSSPIIANCTFKANTAASGGGALDVESTSTAAAEPIIENCVFTANVASRATDGKSTPWYGGGAIFINRGTDATAPALTMYNCTVSANTIANAGSGTYGAASGGIFAWESNPAIDSSVIYSNTSGAIQNQRFAYGSVTAAVVNYSDVEGGYAGTLNINSAPLLNAYLGLQSGSPCIGTGNSGNPGALASDLAGVPRPIATLDMGAFEYVPSVPSAICLNPTVSLDASGNATATLADVEDPSTSAAGGIYSVSTSPTLPKTYTCSNLGSGNSVTMTVTDFLGQTGTCTATVTVQDIIKPTMNCVDFPVSLSAAGSYTLTAGDLATITAGCSDNDTCHGITSRLASQTTFTCANVGPNTVTITAGDFSGNTNTQDVTITVSDVTPPTVLTKNISVTLDGTGNAAISDTDVNNGSSDACGIASITTSPKTFTCTDVPSKVVTMTVVDNNGNSAQGTATVTVSDTQSPTAVCNATPATVQLDASGAATIDAASLDGGSTDNCASAFTYAANPATVSCSDAGTTAAIVLTVTDPAGNSDTCTAYVPVEDKVKPTVVCKNISVDLVGSSIGILPSDVDSGSSDACGIAGMVLDKDTFTCANLGANTVTLTVTDVNGNSDSCQATVTVNDVTAPTPVCNPITVTLANDTYTLNSADIDALILGSTDNCSTTLSAVAAPDTFNCDNVGPNTVTLTIKDASNNSVTCQSTVNVNATLVLTAPAPATASKYEGEAASFSVTACGGNDIANYVYTWYFDADGLGSGAPVALTSGAPHPADSATTVSVTSNGRTSALDLGNLKVGAEGEYFCQITDGTSTADSINSVLMVYHALAIDQQPASVTKNETQTAEFSVTLVGHAGMPPFTYTWEWYNGSSWDTLVNGAHPSGSGSEVSNADTATVSILLSDNGIQDAGQYRVTITDSGTPQTVTSDETATLSVTNFMAASINPATVNAYTGENIVLKVTVGNGIAPYTYAWTKDGSPIAETTDTLNLGTAGTSDKGTYKVTVDDSNPSNPPVDTNESVVDVRPAPHITVQPEDEFVYAGQYTSISVTVVDGYPPYTYLWRAFHNPLGYPSLPVLAAPVSMAYDGGIIDVLITDQGSSLSGQTVLDANDVILHVGSPVNYLLQPQDYRAYSDEAPFDLSATFEGGLYLASYEWSRTPAAGGAATSFGVNTGTIPNTVTLTVDPAGENGSYDYKVAITDAVTTATSDNARVDFANHVQFTKTLSDAEVNQHTYFAFEVAVEGGLPPVSYQWFKDDGAKAWQPITGANGPKLEFTNPVESDSGLYKVEVTEGDSAQGNATPLSSQATLTVTKGIPVVGGLGLAALTALTALLGAGRIRRRK